MRFLHRFFIGAAFLFAAFWASLIGYSIAKVNVEGALTATAILVAVVTPTFWGAIDYAFRRSSEDRKPF